MPAHSAPRGLVLGQRLGHVCLFPRGTLNACVLQVHRSVEQRVKEALARAEQLEQQQEQTAKQTAEKWSQMQQQQADLESELAAARDRLAELDRELSAAQTAGEWFLGCHAEGIPVERTNLLAM